LGVVVFAIGSHVGSDEIGTLGARDIKGGALLAGLVVVEPV
jgi:hypothetical protein